jgi:hypothetical protein
MGPSLMVVVGLARSTEVKMPRLQRCSTISDVDGALAVAAFVADVAEPFFPVVSAEARHFVDYFCVAA